jgi:hypothetical protein
MSTSLNLTGRWLGHYQQHDRAHLITAEFLQAGERLTGSMRDRETQSEYSVFQLAAEQGLPPGADEQIVAALREMVPDAGFFSMVRQSSKIESDGIPFVRNV